MLVKTCFFSGREYKTKQNKIRNFSIVRLVSKNITPSSCRPFDWKREELKIDVLSFINSKRLNLVFLIFAFKWWTSWWIYLNDHKLGFYQIKNPAESKEEPGACYVGLIHTFFFSLSPCTHYNRVKEVSF